MDPTQQDALVDVIRAIIGVNDDADISREQILALLQQARGDPNKAVDLYFQSQQDANSSSAESGGDSAHAQDHGAQRQSGGTPVGKVTAHAQAPVATAAAAASPAKSAATPKSPDTSLRIEWTRKAVELSELLGGDVEKDVIIALLRRTNDDLQKAVEIYFAEQGDADAATQRETEEEDMEEDEIAPAGAQHSAAAASDMHPVPQHALEPLTPPPAPVEKKEVVAVANAPSTSPPSVAELESMVAPGTYEVIMVDSQFRWQIGNVFGRAVVQWVDPAGPAARAGIHKTDVLLSFRDTVVTEHNCTQIVQELTKERIVVPSSMRLRRAPEAHPSSLSTAASATAKPAETAQPVPMVDTSSPSETDSAGDAKPAATEVPREEDGDVVMTPAPPADAATINGSSNDPVVPKYGLQILCQAVDSMMDAMGTPSVENKVLVDLLLLAEFNLDRSLNNYFNEHRIVSDFRRVVGYDWDPNNPDASLKVQSYNATIPAGPLGLTVENILERTIVVDIKPNGAAERASVKRSSWLVRLNEQPVTHLTHKETLRMIETASRPLQLELVLMPQDDYRSLRRQLSMSIRQQKTERAIAEQDRMSFRVFQLKIHQAVLVMPKLIVKALFRHLTSEQLAPLSGSNAVDPLDELFKVLLPKEFDGDVDACLIREAQHMEEERSGDMCEERKFMLNVFAAIHEHDDKGESIVIRTIQFLGWLAKRYAVLEQHSASMLKIPQSEHSDNTSSAGTSKDSNTGMIGSIIDNRYTLLLSVATHVLESLSIIENHATWDVMVDAFRLLIRAMTDDDINTMIIPMLARLSISPSPTARIVPVALLSLVYPRVEGDVCVQLRGMLDRMCNDDNPLVRRAIASIIGDLVRAGGSGTSQWGVHLLEKATGDSHDIVRIFAVKSCLSLAKNLRSLLPVSGKPTEDSKDETLRLLLCQMVPMVNTYTSDSSWQVRLEAAKTLPSFCFAFGSEYTDVLVDHFVGMARDPTVEIRRTCAEMVFSMGNALVQLAVKRAPFTSNATDSTGDECTESNAPPPAVEQVAVGLENIDIKSVCNGGGSNGDPPSEFVIAAQTKIVKSIVPAMYALSNDLSVAVRLALAKSVGKSLQLLPSTSYDDLVPMFTQILDENQDVNVRASLLEEMARHCDLSTPSVASMLVPSIKALRSSGQWRVRVKFVQCVDAWAGRCDRSSVPIEFADSTLEMLADVVYDVRAVACTTIATLARSIGDDWFATKAIPHISHCMQSTFNGRVTGLLAIEAVAPQLKAMDKLREVIESVVEECTSNTPNLRFRALRSLGLLVPLLDEKATTENTIEFVRPLTLIETESDADVRDTATTTLELLEAHLKIMPTSSL